LSHSDALLVGIVAAAFAIEVGATALFKFSL
jgi:hypothetical protein